MSNRQEELNRIHAEQCLLFNVSAQNIEFAKRQQWWITSQIILIYAALYFVYSQIGGVIMYIILPVVATFACLISVYVLYDCHLWHRSERKRLDHIRKHSFDEKTRAASLAKERFRIYEHDRISNCDILQNCCAARLYNYMSKNRHAVYLWIHISVTITGLIAFLSLLIFADTSTNAPSNSTCSANFSPSPGG